MPIRTKSSVVSEEAPSADVPAVVEAVPPVRDREEARGGRQKAEGREQEVIGEGQKAVEEGSLEVWRERALCLQAEIENFRKRQQRLAEERIAADRERLLRSFLRVADDLERALNADETDIESLRQGVDLIYQNLVRLLGREGVESIQAEGQPFDPAWHEAVGTVPHLDAEAQSDIVVEVVRPGYRLGNRLLSPAHVVVAT